jgi:hypothetical protein
MDQASEFIKGNAGTVSTVLLVIGAIIVVYAVYTYLYPPNSPTYARLVRGEVSARKPLSVSGTLPSIYTGGDFTLSFWMYVDDYNYRASAYKFVFALSPVNQEPNTASPLVGVLTPLENGMMVRANTIKSTVGALPAGSSVAPATATPDITIQANLQSILNQQSSMSMFQTTLEQPCDLKEVPLQRWVNITIVSSGRVLDVYLDGKLTRSCVLDSVLNVPRTPLQLQLGQNGGFSGRYSSVQMWGTQLTPDVIYGIYQMGPSQAEADIFSFFRRLFSLNVSFTEGAPGQSSPSISSIERNAQSNMSDLSSMESKAQTQAQALMARF